MNDHAEAVVAKGRGRLETEEDIVFAQHALIPRIAFPARPPSSPPGMYRSTTETGSGDGVRDGLAHPTAC